MDLDDDIGTRSITEEVCCCNFDANDSGVIYAFRIDDNLGCVDFSCCRVLCSEYNLPDVLTSPKSCIGVC